MGDKPLITTGVDITLDTPTTIRVAGILIAIAVLLGVAIHFTFKALGR